MKRTTAILIAILALFIPNILLRLLIFAIAAALFFTSTNKKKRQQGGPIGGKRKYSSNKVDAVSHYQALEAESRKKSAETPPNAPLVGKELIGKVRELGDVAKSDLVRACGYVSTSQDGKENLNFTAFHEALVEASGTELRPLSNQSKQLDYQLTTASDGSLVLSSDYTALLNLAPGDEFVALPQTWTKSIRLLPREIAEELDGDEEFESIIQSKRYNCIIDQNLELNIPSAAIQTIGATTRQNFNIKLKATEILIELNDTNLDRNPQNNLSEQGIDYAAIWELITVGKEDIGRNGRNFLTFTHFHVDEEAAKNLMAEEDWDAYCKLECDIGVELSGDDFGHGAYICKRPEDLPRMIKDYLNKGGSISSITQAFEKRKSANNEYKAVKLTIIETGGQYTIGVVSEPNHSRQIKSKIIESEMSSYFDYDDGSHFDISECNELLDVYGPHVPGSQLIVEDENSNEIYRGSIDESALTIFQSSNPYTWPHSKNENELIIFNKKIEKRIHYSAEIKAKSNNSIRLKEIYVGYCLMDESFCTDDEILEYVLYIPDEKALEYFREWSRLEGDTLDGSESADDFRDLVGEMFYKYNNTDFCKKIVNNHRISADEIEGKGEWECDYIKVAKATSNDPSEFLYEDEGY